MKFNLSYLLLNYTANSHWYVSNHIINFYEVSPKLALSHTHDQNVTGGGVEGKQLVTADQAGEPTLATKKSKLQVTISTR